MVNRLPLWAVTLGVAAVLIVLATVLVVGAQNSEPVPGTRKIGRASCRERVYVLV